MAPPAKKTTPKKAAPKKPAAKPAAKKATSQSANIAQNRKARFEYTLGDHIEAGIVLLGTEVKSMRAGRTSMNDAYAGPKQGEIWLFNCYIGEYEQASRFNHEPLRPRKLLLHKTQMSKLLGQLRTKGVTLVPLSLYFNSRGIAKVKLGIATGKKQFEKRQTIKDRDWKRDKERLMKNNNR